MPITSTDDSDVPARTPRGPGPPGTSGGGGGGGIAAFGGGGNFIGGFAPGGFGAPGSAENPRRKKFYAQLGNHPVGQTDTVPAMLSPGEFVVNAPAAQQNYQQLAQINGGDPSQHMAHGGSVPNFCPNCGYCHGGMVGYAGGGSVDMSRFGWKGLGQASQSPPQGGGMTVGQPPGGGGYTYNPEGGVTGGYNPSDPYGAYSNNHDTRTYGAGVREFGGYGAAGYYDPNGPASVLNGLEEQGNRDANDYAGRVYNQAGLDGADPGQASSLKLRALASAGRGVSDRLGQYRTDFAMRRYDDAQRLRDNLMGADFGFTGQTNQARLNDWEQGRQQGRQGNGLGGMIGGLVGTAAGSFAGPFGAQLGGALGSRLGGGGRAAAPAGGGAGYNPYRTYPQQP